MPLVVVSCSHENASFDLLGRIALSEPLVPGFLHLVAGCRGIREVVCLSTCNRTEVYCVADDADAAAGHVVKALADFRNVDREELWRHALVLEQKDAARHLMATACGVRSLIVGELEILGQVRRAWEMAVAHGTGGDVLEGLFQRAVRVGRRARSETGISRGNLSVASVAVGMIRNRLSDLCRSRALVIGTGEVGSKVLELLNKSGVSAMMLVNRTAQKAQTLAEQMGCTPVPMERMVEAIGDADIVVCATGAPHFVVRTEMVRQAAPAGGCRILVDLSAPPNIDPAVGDVAGNVLLTIADLQDIAGRNSEQRQQEMDSVEGIIDGEMARMEREPETRLRRQIVRDFRIRMEEIRRRHLANAGRRFDEQTREELDRYSRSLVSALLHGIVENVDRLPVDTPEADLELEVVRKLLLATNEEELPRGG